MVLFCVRSGVVFTVSSDVPLDTPDELMTGSLAATLESGDAEVMYISRPGPQRVSRHGGRWNSSASVCQVLFAGHVVTGFVGRAPCARFGGGWAVALERALWQRAKRIEAWYILEINDRPAVNMLSSW